MKSYIILEKEQISLMKQGRMQACVLPIESKVFESGKFDDFSIEHVDGNMVLSAKETSTGAIHADKTYLKHAGDLLYVKEGYFSGEYNYSPDEYKGDPPEETFFYEADGPRRVSWFSPSSMHKALSRFTLQITEIKVLRIFNVSDAEIHAMGLIGYNNISDPMSAFIEYETRYGGLLRPFSENRNPWVLLIKFNVIKKNILEVQNDIKQTFHLNPSSLPVNDLNKDLSKALKEGLRLEFSFNTDAVEFNTRYFVGKILFNNELITSSKIRV